MKSTGIILHFLCAHTLFQIDTNYLVVVKLQKDRLRFDVLKYKKSDKDFSH